MMLKTSSNKVNPFSNMLKFSFKRNFGIVVLAVIAFLLICPAYLLINIKDTAAEYIPSTLDDWLCGFSVFAGFACSISVIGFNLLNFSFMFKRPSSDFTDSLPITRVELFVSKVISGYCLSLIPALLSLLSLGVVSVLYGCPKIWGGLLINILYILIVTAVCSAFSMVFIIASASAFDFLISFCGINAGLIALGLILCSMCEELLLGYDNVAYTSVLKAICPLFYTFFGFCYHIFEESANSIGWSFIIRNIIMAVVFAALSLLLYKKRKTETNGKAFAYKFPYIICAFLISVCASYAFGWIFAEGFNIGSILFYGFALIGALIASVIYGVITYRGFKTVKRSLILGGVSFLSIIVVMVAIKLDFTGYSRKIPSANEIKTVTVRSNAGDIEYTDFSFVTNMHKKIVNQKGVAVTNENYGSDSTTISFEYSLKNGKTLKRLYWIHTEKLGAEISEMLKSDERFDCVKKALNSRKPQTVSFYIYNSTNDLNDAYLTYDETMKFLEIYKSEIEKFDFNGYSENLPVCSVSWRGREHYYSFDFFFDDKNFKNTSEYLESLILKDRSQKYEEAVMEEYE